MNTEKDSERKELQRMVDQFLSKGGKIEQVPIGVSGNDHKYHGYRVIGGKTHLHGLSQEKKGFRKERIFLTPSTRSSSVF